MDVNNWGSNLTLKGQKETVTENYPKIVFAHILREYLIINYPTRGLHVAVAIRPWSFLFNVYWRYDTIQEFNVDSKAE